MFHIPPQTSIELISPLDYETWSCKLSGTKAGINHISLSVDIFSGGSRPTAEATTSTRYALARCSPVLRIAITVISFGAFAVTACGNPVNHLSRYLDAGYSSQRGHSL